MLALTHTPAAARTLWPIAGPLFAELSIGIGAGLLGTLLAAQLSDHAAATFALANQVAAALFVLFRIIGAGAGVVVAQSVGAGRTDAADATTRAVIGASTYTGLLTLVTAALGADALVRAMQAPSEVAAATARLLVWLSPALLLDAWSASLSSILRARLQNRAVLAVTIGTTILQLSLAAPLMLGFGEWSGMGLIGFAIAQCVARAVAILAFCFVVSHTLGFRFRWRDWLAFRWQPLKPVLHIGVPGAAETIAYRLAFLASLAAAGTLGASALSTQAYALQISYLAVMFGLSIGLSTEIAVGHLAGAGQVRALDRLVRGALTLGLALAVVATVISAATSPWSARLFTADEKIVESVTLSLWLTVVLEVGRTSNLVLINALRAAGDARFPVVAGIVSMTLFLGAGSWVFAVHLGWGLVGIWVAYIADEWCRGILMWWRWRSRVWTSHARVVRRRLTQHA